MNWLSITAVFLGGGVGSLLRYGMSALFRSLEVQTLALATISSNVIASALLGIVVFRINPSVNSPLFLFLAVGLCGGFSTFSTFSLETLQFFRNGQIMWGVANILVTVIVCVLIMYILSRSNP